MRRAAVGLLGATLGFSGGVPGLDQDPSQRPAFRAATDVVTINVSVRRRNAPVVGLTAHDFELFDNGVPQRVELETIETVPVDVSVVLNIRLAETGSLRSSVASDLATIAQWLRPIDRLRVVAYGTDVREVLPMEAPSKWGREGFPGVALSQAAEALALAGRQQLGVDSLFDAVVLALARPPDLGRRHLVIPFCIPWETTSAVSDGSSLEAVAARSDALLHVALWGGRTEGLPTASVMTLYTRSALTAAAVATGGELHYVGGGGVGGFKSIFEDFRRSYLLQYTLTGVPPGGWHDVVVKTPRFPEYAVRARKGYIGR